MNLCSKVFVGTLIALFSGCGLTEEDEGPLLISSKIYDFGEADHGWEHGFADYPAGPDDSAYYELKYEYSDQLVSSLGVKMSHMLSAFNRDQDLFMFLKKRVEGLRPNTDYTITFSVEFVSDFTEATDSGQGVFLKAGATHLEPKSVIEAGYRAMNIDKGDQSLMGEDMATLGEVPAPLDAASGYSIITKSNTMSNTPYVAKSDSNGVLWLIVGTDSNVPGTTRVFYTKVNVVFSAS